MPSSCYKCLNAFYNLWTFTFMDFQKISIEARCRDKSVQKFLANALGYPMNEEEEPLIWMRQWGHRRPISQQGREAWEGQLMTKTTLVRQGDYQMNPWIDHLDNMLKIVSWMQLYYIGCTLIFQHWRM